MTKLTLSRADLMSGNWQNTKVESYPSPDDVPIIPVLAKILIDWMDSPEGMQVLSAIKSGQAERK
jgi:hypothetical protein